VQPNITHASLGLPESIPKRHLDRFSHFCTTHSRRSLKIAHLHRGLWTTSTTWFLGPTRVHNPNDVQISLAVFAGLMSVTDRLTDYVTLSVPLTIGRIYIRSTAMRLNNTNICDITSNSYLQATNTTRSTVKTADNILGLISQLATAERRKRNGRHTSWLCHSETRQDELVKQLTDTKTQMLTNFRLHLRLHCVS